jgi:3D (Asp-Asp-Asp) domain-containing protein
MGAVLAAGGVAAASGTGDTPTINSGQVSLLGQDDIEIRQGMRGEGVREVQEVLNRLGFSAGEADGVFGARTESAVRDFQILHELPSTGVVDAATFEAMRRAAPLSSRGMRIIPMQASGYSAYDPGNSCYTATGSLLRRGIAAVDTSLIALGTKLFIPGYGYAVADDTGGAIVGATIDLAFDSHEEALWFGRRDVVVYIVD